MSLTTFLQSPAIDSQMEALICFPRGLTFGVHPLVPAGTPRQTLIGSAFDYLLRFILQRRFSFAITRPWVAEEGLHALETKLIKQKRLAAPISPNTLALAFDLLGRAKRANLDFIEQGVLTNDTLKSVLYLAHIDLLIRSRKVGKEFGVVYLSDMNELRGLAEIIPDNVLNPRSSCILNPTFGQASIDIGGADADLILDGTLIEIKTSKSPIFSKAYTKQLIGYYILSTLGGIDQAPIGTTIERIGVYSSRYGKLLTIPLPEILPPASRQWLIDSFQARLRSR
ncbi:hypothetical protein [Archangium sp.]|uniref:hypothetical protein n=1 Tax=Archangium sp. TaxID=1872627 RepID=UPI00389A13AD